METYETKIVTNACYCSATVLTSKITKTLQKILFEFNLDKP